ncbi:MAG: DUF4625 domain-containing protein [Chitinophagales bacterium]|nr:DUF4625 domain-containing protein [Chitinophagales bacterium]
MKTKTIIIVAAIFAVSIITSCNKNEDNTDTQAPVIELIEPTSATTYMSGDTVFIHATITDNDELHEISSLISRTHMGVTDTVWTFDTHSHTASYDLYGYYVIEVPGMHNDFELFVTASDHNENESTQTFSFHVMQ